MTKHPLQALAPCKQSLLQLAVMNLDESMLREIAAADYSMDQQVHDQALTNICRGIMPAPNDWHPLEVLRLTRSSEPDRPHHPNNAVGHRGH